jgi:hypothetical protein
MPIIPATHEAEMGGSWFKASLGKKRGSEPLSQKQAKRGGALL